MKNDSRLYLGLLSIQHDANQRNRAQPDLHGVNVCPDAANIAFLKQSLRSAMAGCGTDIHTVRQLCVGHASVALQELKNPAVNRVQIDPDP